MYAGKKSLGIPKSRWEDNLKINLKEIGSIFSRRILLLGIKYAFLARRVYHPHVLACDTLDGY
jgi:hypothetical protein